MNSTQSTGVYFDISLAGLSLLWSGRSLTNLFSNICLFVLFQAFEEKLSKPISDKKKREVFKKLVEEVIGVSYFCLTLIEELTRIKYTLE